MADCQPYNIPREAEVVEWQTRETQNLLRATASDADEDGALYGEEEPEHGDEAEIGVSLPH